MGAKIIIFIHHTTIFTISRDTQIVRLYFQIESKMNLSPYVPGILNQKIINLHFPERYRKYQVSGVPFTVHGHGIPITSIKIKKCIVDKFSEPTDCTIRLTFGIPRTTDNKNACPYPA